MTIEDLIKGLETSADWLNGLVLFTLGVAAAVLLLKILQQDKIRIWGIELQVTSVWIPFLALTFAHAGLALIHLKGASALMYAPTGVERNDPIRTKAWQVLTIRGPLIFRHVVSRARIGLLSLPNPFHPFSDPLALPTYISAVGFWTAHIRWKGVSGRRRLLWIGIGLISTIVNWWIASCWIFGTAELSGSRDAADYLMWFR